MPVALGPEAEAEILSAQDQAVGMDVGVVLRRQTALFRHVDMHRQAGRGGRRHIVLEREDILDPAIITLGPDRVFCLRLDQVDGDPQPASRAPEASREQVAHTKLVADFSQRLRMRGNRESGVPRDDHEVAETAEIGNEIGDHTLAEVEVGWISRNIFERQDRQRTVRRRLLWRWRRRKRQREGPWTGRWASSKSTAKTSISSSIFFNFCLPSERNEHCCSLRTNWCTESATHMPPGEARPWMRAAMLMPWP